MCERIPTIGTQLRILSTVKATLLGAQGLLYFHKIAILIGHFVDRFPRRSRSYRNVDRQRAKLDAIRQGNSSSL